MNGHKNSTLKLSTILPGPSPVIWDDICQKGKWSKSCERISRSRLQTNINLNRKDNCNKTGSHSSFEKSCGCIANPTNENVQAKVHQSENNLTPISLEDKRKLVHDKKFDLPSIRVFSDKNILVCKDDFFKSKFQNAAVSKLKTDPFNENFSKPCKPGSLYVTPIKKHCPSANGELYVSPVDQNSLKSSRKPIPVHGNSKRTRFNYGNSALTSVDHHFEFCLRNKIAARAFITEMLNEQMTSLLRGSIYDRNKLNDLQYLCTKCLECVNSDHRILNSAFKFSNINSRISCNGCCLHNGKDQILILAKKGERVGEVYGSFTSIAPTAHNGSSVELPNNNKLPTAKSAPIQTMLVTDDPYQLKGFDQHSVEQKGSKKVIGSSSKYTVTGEYGIQENGGFEGGDIFDGSFNFDASFADPGYVSEKSDYNSEDENSDEVVVDFTDQDRCITDPSDGSIITLDYVMKICPFVTYENIFYVNLIKNSRGLGLSVTGGIDCEIIWSGLVRVKKIFPQTPAALCCQLEVNDVLLEANQVPLTGLSSHEALEVLRTSGAEVNILACRPPSGVFDPVSASQCAVVTNSLPIPSQNSSSNYLIPSPSFSTYGDFEINITKVNGSLGFTLRKQDNSILGHTVRSLVKEPALSDGRIRPGDKLLSVNGTDMCGLSHEEAVRFLRTCPETVVLRLYRDALQTPVSPASPIETEFFSKPKQLRKEARDMLTDLAFRKQTSSANSSGNLISDSAGSNRRRRLQKTPSPDLNPTSPERWDSLVRKSEETQQSKLSSPIHFNNEECHTSTNSHYGYKETSFDKIDCGYRPKRPDFLDLTSQTNCTRKAKLTPPYSEPAYDIMPELRSPQMNSLDSVPTKTSTLSDAPKFNRSQPSYHSVNVGTIQGIDQELTNTTSDHDINSYTQSSGKQKGLMKWKGIVFTPEEENSHHSQTDDLVVENTEIITINLSRGWNSRLGFSLQPRNNKTVIVNVYSDSLAARDGRLTVGDEIIKINNKNVANWQTENVIELLRKTPGKICLEVKKNSVT